MSQGQSMNKKRKQIPDFPKHEVTTDGDVFNKKI